VGTFDCDRCNATGSVPQEMLQWLETGRSLMLERKGLSLSLREMANRLRADFGDLIRAEQGFIDPSPLLQRARELAA
jgi:hypothetical protein